MLTGVVLCLLEYVPKDFTETLYILAMIGLACCAGFLCLFFAVITGMLYWRRIRAFDAHELNIRFERFDYNVASRPLDCGHLFVIRVVTVALLVVSAVIRRYFLPAHPSRHITWSLTWSLVKQFLMIMWMKFIMPPEPEIVGSLRPTSTAPPPIPLQTGDAAYPVEAWAAGPSYN